MRGHRVGDDLALERAARCQHLVKHAAERPDVGAPVRGLAPRLFGRHIRRGAEDHAQPGGRQSASATASHPTARPVASRSSRLGQPEIEDLHDALVCHLDVRGLQVAVNDPCFHGRLRAPLQSAVRSAAPPRPASVPARCARRASGLRRARGPAHARRRPLRCRGSHAMSGWLSAASSCASRLKRASRSGSCVSSSGRTFRATPRLSRASRAR